MAYLEFKFLGEMSLCQDGEPLAELKSRKGQALLCYLAVTGKRCTRSRLAGLLWSDMPEANALMNLRKTLNRLKPLWPYLVIDRAALAFNPDNPYRLDVQEFETAAAARSDISRLQSAVSLYQGDFLAGFDSDAFTLFDEWVLSQRARLHDLALQTLQILVTHFKAQQNGSLAIRYARQRLALEPWHEETHLELMALLAQTGQRTAALAQYETCRKILAEELDVKPALATVQLYEQIKNGKFASLEAGPEAPIPPSSPSRTHNLPVQATALIGRLSETATLKAYLSDPQIRLVSIVGMGGMGKTHLAAANASALAAAGAFSDGVFFVPLGHVATRQHLVLAVGEQLKLSLAAARAPEEQLLSFLRDQQLLIVLDNFEQLLPETEFLERLLAAAPRLKVLVTSRARSRLNEEWVLDLAGLPYPASLNDASAPSADAVRLFDRRARQVQASFNLVSHLPAVVRICQLTQGMPLALELAASWVRAQPVEQIADQLAQSLLSLSTDLRNIPARHQNMHALFDRTWQWLADAERQVLRALAVFRGGFTAETAWQLTGWGSDPAAGAAILADLMDKSLLSREAGSAENSRYAMHELVRQYAYDRLFAAGEAETIHARHLATFLALAEQADRFWDTPQEGAWLRRLEAERGNLNAALGWALDQGQAEAVLRLNAALFTFWIYTSPISEASNWLASALALPWDKGSVAAMSIRAKVLNIAGYTNVRTGAFAQAQDQFEEGLALFSHLEQARGIAWSQRGCGFVAMIQGDYARARPYLEQSLAGCQASQDEWGLDWSIYDLGYLALARGIPAEADARLEEALGRFRQGGIAFGVYRTLIALGHLRRSQQLWAQASDCYREALRLGQQDRFSQVVADALEGLAQVAVTRGEFKAAAWLFGAAQARRDSIEVVRWVHLEADYQCSLAHLQAQLPGPALAQAWQEGQAKPFEQAISAALACCTFESPGPLQGQVIQLYS